MVSLGSHVMPPQDPDYHDFDVIGDGDPIAAIGSPSPMTAESGKDIGSNCSLVLLGFRGLVRSFGTGPKESTSVTLIAIGRLKVPKWV